MSKIADIPKDYLSDFPPALRQILWSRGFRDEAELQKYLYPRLQDVCMPQGLLKDLDSAIQILLQARYKKEKVLIFGDYDVDGTTSTALLYRSLADLGWSVDWFIPHRVREGYGITLKAVERLKEEKSDFSVLISCDCGISSFDGIQALRDLGKKIIVTDHHECPEERVSAHAVLNPKQKDCRYPEKILAGVGVAFLLVLALRRALEARDYSLRSHLELVAIGTVCDMAELRGCNRIFVKSGLRSLSQSSFPGVRAILQSAGLETRKLKSQDLGFIIGPRLNAVGRIGDPSLGFKTLMSSEKQAMHFAGQLEHYNQQRRKIQAEHIEQALEWIQSRLQESQEVAVVYHPEFHLGVVGLVASKLSEKYGKAFCVLSPLEDEHELENFSKNGNIWKGSLRAPKGFDLAKTLQSISQEIPDLFLSYGGHAQAAGVALREEKIEIFEQAFIRKLNENKIRSSSYESDFLLEDPRGLNEILDWMEPLGQANPAPLVEVRDYQVERVQVLKQEHLKLFGRWSQESWPVLHFRSPWVNIFSGSGRLDFIGELTENHWMGQKRLEFVLKDVLDWKASGRKNVVERKPNEICDRQSL